MAFQAKRQYKRRAGREAVKLLSSRGVEYAIFEDISAGGLKIRMDRQPEIGQRFIAEFLLPYGGSGPAKNLSTQVEVVRAEKRNSHFDIGVRFVEVDSQSKQLLGSAVDLTAGEF